MKRPETAAHAVARALYYLHNGVVIPNYEPLLRQCYTRFLKQGNIVFDVGSHIGLHFAHFVELGARGAMPLFNRRADIAICFHQPRHGMTIGASPHPQPLSALA